MPSEKSNVPPELQPYYRPTRGARLRRAGLLILPLLAAVVLIGALIGGGWWLAHRNQNKTASNSSQHSTETAQAPTEPTPAEPAPTTQQPAETPTPATQTPTSSTPTSTPASTSTLANTGPDAMGVLLAGAIGSIAAVAFHVRQRRVIRD